MDIANELVVRTSDVIGAMYLVAKGYFARPAVLVLDLRDEAARTLLAQWRTGAPKPDGVGSELPVRSGERVPYQIQPVPQEVLLTVERLACQNGQRSHMEAELTKPPPDGMFYALIMTEEGRLSYCVLREPKIETYEDG